MDVKLRETLENCHLNGMSENVCGGSVEVSYFPVYDQRDQKSKFRSLLVRVQCKTHGPSYFKHRKHSRTYAKKDSLYQNYIKTYHFEGFDAFPVFSWRNDMF